MDDKQILELYWQREETAIRETDNRYHSYCFCVANNILQNIEDAEECVNDTWLNAWNSIPPQMPDCLRLYLAKIVRNLAFNRFIANRTKKRGGGEIFCVLDELAECIPSESDVESEYIAKELGLCIREFINSLPERDANIFLRRYFFTDSISMIAARYGFSENNITVILSRTRKKLRTHLVKEGYLDEQKRSIYQS